jgi:hypothetical protein
MKRGVVACNPTLLLKDTCELGDIVLKSVNVVSSYTCVSDGALKG